MQTPNCLRCGSQMAAGFLMDGHRGNIDVSRWIDGDPRRGIFGGLKLPPWKDRLPVRALRCSKCGWLDLYANREPEPH